MNFFKFILNNIRIVIFGNFREIKLAEYISFEISQLIKQKDKLVKILDFGSGMQPLVTKMILENLKKHKPHTNFVFHCYDFYNKQNLAKLELFDSDINFYHLNKFDNNEKNYNFAIILDVLHHIDVRKKKVINDVLSKISLKSEFVIIKDHYQYGYFSNFLLILMDFIGNYYNDVKIPSHYFSITSYKEYLLENNLFELKNITNKAYYKKYWIFFSNPKLHFISILESKKND